MVRGYSQLKKYDVDTSPVDAWTVVHFGAGLAAGLVGFPLLLTLAAAMFWEAAENWRRPALTSEAFPHWTPEVNTNVLIDVVAAVGGWGFGAALAGAR